MKNGGRKFWLKCDYNVAGVYNVGMASWSILMPEIFNEYSGLSLMPSPKIYEIGGCPTARVSWHAAWIASQS